MEGFTPFSSLFVHGVDEELAGKRRRPGCGRASGHKKTRSPKLKQGCFALAVFLTRPQAELKSAQGER
jgi:hypothetical protein